MKFATLRRAAKRTRFFPAFGQLSQLIFLLTDNYKCS
jgi:hypothetical protein